MPDNSLPDDSLDCTPDMILNDVKSDFKEPVFWPHRPDIAHPSKIFVVVLNDEENQYITRWYNGGMCLSEIVALLEIMKLRVLNTMHGKD